MTATMEAPAQNRPRIDLDSMIARTPGIRGGRPRLAGTGVSVQRIAGYFKYWGWSAEEIAAQLPSVNLAQVYAALAYHHANREEIEGYLAEEEAAFPAPETAATPSTPATA